MKGKRMVLTATAGVWLALAAFLTAGVSPAAAVNFDTIDFPGVPETYVSGINNQGVVMGAFSDPQGNHGFVYDGVAYTTIDIPAATTFAAGINDAGTVAGYYLLASGTTQIFHGFTSNGVSHTTVDVPGATHTGLAGITNTGRLTGFYQNTASTTLHGCVSSDTTPVNLLNYWLPNPLSRRCSYSYITPEGFPGFTLRFTPVTSGPYAGKYRMGDWNTPEDELAVWRIVSWDAQVLYVYADSQIGDLPSPVWFSTTFPQDTAIPNPLPGEEGIYWYFKTIPSFTVAAGTFSDILIDIILDSAYPPNSRNAALGLTVPYAVTCVTYYGRGIGELKMEDVEAQTGNIRFSYELQSTGVGGGTPSVLLLLGD